jgi:hypothetical protein
LRMMAQVSVERSSGFQLAGAALVSLAGLIGYGVYIRVDGALRTAVDQIGSELFTIVHNPDEAPALSC